jgi:hypothetical protein
MEILANFKTGSTPTSFLGSQNTPSLQAHQISIIKIPSKRFPLTGISQESISLFPRNHPSPNNCEGLPNISSI